jgi:Tat protein translocase TatB subunit
VLNIGPGEFMVILLIALLVVGPKRLPEISRSLGKALREFRRLSSDAQEQIKQVVDLDALNPLSALSGPASSAVAPGSGPAATSPATPDEPPPAVDLGPPVTGGNGAAKPPVAAGSAVPEADDGGRPVDLGPPSPA